MSYTIEPYKKSEQYLGVPPSSPILIKSQDRPLVPQKSVASDLATLWMNARVLTSHNEHALALNILRRATNLDSKNLHTLKLLCQCLETMEHWTELISVQSSIIKFAFSLDAIFSLAMTYYKIGKDDEALRGYFECMAVISNEDERLFEIYKNVGNIFVRQRDFEAAEEYYNKAHAMRRDEDVLLVNFGTLEVQREDYEKALYCFRSAVDSNCHNDKAWVGLAMVHYHFGDFDLAWGNIERAIDINPMNSTTLQVYATWALSRNQTERAIGLLQARLSTVAGDDLLSILLIRMFCQKGLHDLAALEIERAFQWNPGNADLQQIRKEFVCQIQGNHKKTE